jgi:hypothetical protein
VESRCPRQRGSRAGEDQLEEKGRFAGSAERLAFIYDQRRVRPSGLASLIVPAQLHGLKTTYGSDPEFHDHIAWFMGDFDLESTGRTGVIDFAGAVYQEITLRQMSYHISDHFPLWVEFITDQSTRDMAPTLGLDPATPDPLDTVPA